MKEGLVTDFMSNTILFAVRKLIVPPSFYYYIGKKNHIYGAQIKF